MIKAIPLPFIIVASIAQVRVSNIISRYGIMRVPSRIRNKQETPANPPHAVSSVYLPDQRRERLKAPMRSQGPECLPVVDTREDGWTLGLYYFEGKGGTGTRGKPG